MIKLILEAFIAFFQGLPIIEKWFEKSSIDQAEKDRAAVDQEQEKDAKTGRPSDEFWNKRHL